MKLLKKTTNSDSGRERRFSRRQIIFIVLAASALIFFVWGLLFYLSLPNVDYLKKKNPKTTALMELRKAQAKDKGKRYRIRQRWVRFSRIPRLFKQAVRITEDASFYQHEGVDYDELKESIRKDWEQGKLARGGSTITQQLAKNLFLTTEKSFLRKIKEYFIARRLEEALSKNRIFHLYLNIIEFGRGVFGVQAAARYYFKKDVANLSLKEIIRLTAVIPKPLKVNPKGNSRWLKWKSRWILNKLRKYKYITEEQYRETLPAFQ